MRKTILDACCGGKMFYFDKHDGSGFAHAFSLRDTKMLIDIDLKRKEYDSTRID